MERGMKKFSTKTLVRGDLNFDEQHQYGGLTILNKCLLSEDIYYSALPDSLGDIPGKEASWKQVEEEVEVWKRGKIW